MVTTVGEAKKDLDAKFSPHLSELVCMADVVMTRCMHCILKKKEKKTKKHDSGVSFQVTIIRIPGCQLLKIPSSF